MNLRHFASAALRFEQAKQLLPNNEKSLLYTALSHECKGRQLLQSASWTMAFNEFKKARQILITFQHALRNHWANLNSHEKRINQHLQQSEHLIHHATTQSYT